VIVSHTSHPAPRVDCFYVYPTVDLELVPGNHRDLADDRKPRATTVAQAARFTEACAVWTPLYHQVTIGTYLQPKEILERGLAVGFADVERAFREYLATADPQRKIVLVGHSQGAEMVVRLLRRFFDDDPAMRSRLLLALPIGGDVDVATGSTRDGTSKNVPVCTRPDETGCILAYHAYLEGERVDVPASPWKPPAGRETVCVDPSALDAGLPAEERHRFTRAYFTVWPELRRFMRRCVRAAGGYGYLEVAAAPEKGDSRVSPIDLADRRIALGARPGGVHAPLATASREVMTAWSSSTSRRRRGRPLRWP